MGKKKLVQNLISESKKNIKHVFQVIGSYSLVPIPLLLFIWPPVPELLAGEVKSK